MFLKRSVLISSVATMPSSGAELTRRGIGSWLLNDWQDGLTRSLGTA